MDDYPKGLERWPSLISSLLASMGPLENDGTARAEEEEEENKEEEEEEEWDDGMREERGKYCHRGVRRGRKGKRTMVIRLGKNETGKREQRSFLLTELVTKTM